MAGSGELLPASTHLEPVAVVLLVLLWPLGILTSEVCLLRDASEEQREQGFSSPDAASFCNAVWSQEGVGTRQVPGQLSPSL